MNKTLPIGTIASGTTKTEDRFPELLCAVSDCDLESESLGKAVAQFTELWDKIEGDGEEEDELFEGLCTLAEEYLAPYTHLGTLEGDGADFGVWPSIESLEEDAREEIAVLKRADGVPHYVMQVSDHGNVTLWETHAKEVWSIV